ncbi:thiF family domain-containing protein [Ditylenchus destructor]|uniref:NEDD8-activating enzyme E1 catalytic subunit n=1 Tax=Ditylenchus destructor TaxID=166010 RepID=A0AAD4N1J7_9BILA|nr:thiF family domain-containing protein [Ditylenchus destructor]
MRVSVDENQSERWKDIRRFTDRPSAFAHPQFDAGPQNMEEIHKRRVLVVGAGGLGCEILKDLALSGFKNIEVIDMDTIDLSNLNRQFLFRESDIGKSKAQVAAEFIEKRFDIIICGLDSITARRWLNAVVCNLVEFDNGQPDFSTIVPMIDGGTEGFKGHSRIIIPYITPCVECTLDLYPPQVNFPLCTIAHTPRLPEHCVEYVKIILWEKEKPFGDEAIDGDNLKHVDWICEKAQERANEYGIQDVNHRLILGVLKRIIPAVASTNAIIAGSCALEALKLASNISISMNNYLNFTDIEGVNFGVVQLERNPECVVCGRAALTYTASSSTTLSEFLQEIKNKHQLVDPTVKGAGDMLYIINPMMPQMEDVSKANLKKALTG